MPNPKGHEDSIKDSRFKAAWQSGPTRTIRVPIALADATLDYARQLDRGAEPRDTSIKPDVKVSSVFTETRDPANTWISLENARANCTKIVEYGHYLTNQVREEVTQLLSELEGERADRKQVERELSELKQNSALAATLSGKQTPDAATILSKLRAKRKKSKSDLADVEAILEILEN